MQLPLADFKTIIHYAPLISIDLLVHNQNDEYLLGLRRNRPAQGFWFVPGGRIFKDESFQAAFKRISSEELGIELNHAQAHFIGHFDHFYEDNVTGAEFGTHYIALGYRVHVNSNELLLPKEQHQDYCWMGSEELLKHPNVHRHTRWYIDQNA